MRKKYGIVLLVTLLISGMLLTSCAKTTIVPNKLVVVVTPKSDKSNNSESESTPANEALSEYKIYSLPSYKIYSVGTLFEKSVPQKEQIIVLGTINRDNQFVNDTGERFKLGNTQKCLEVKYLVGKKVQIKGVVLERDGQSTVDVYEYKVLE